MASSIYAYLADLGTAAASTTMVWQNWTTGVGTTAVNPWSYWISTNATITTGAVWTAWTTAPYLYQPIPIERTPEEIAALEDAARIQRALAEERAAQTRADNEQAVQRAETLLHDHLNARQRRALRTQGKFRVKAASGRWYEIGRGHHGKLVELGARGRRVNHLCVYAIGGAPEADQMLAQKLYLEANEETLRRVAHFTPIAAPRAPVPV